MNIDKTKETLLINSIATSLRTLEKSHTNKAMNIWDKVCRSLLGRSWVLDMFRGCREHIRK